MRKIYSLAVIGIALASTSFAGTKTPLDVSVDTVGRTAYGQIGTARNSADNLQVLYCTFYGTGNVYCYARNSAGVAGSCTTTNTGIASAIKGMNSDSFLRFWWDASGTCTDVIVGTGSHYEPKNH